MTVMNKNGIYSSISITLNLFAEKKPSEYPYQQDDHIVIFFSFKCGIL
jgi:hypothetical protein